MNFPAKDLSLQHISQSYQGLLQQHGEYVLDGLGNVVFNIGPSGSGGNPVSFVQSSQTSSMSVASASHANTADVSATSSIAFFAEAAESASVAVLATVAINALTASYAPDYIKKSGDTATGDIIGTDFVRTRSGTITRDGDGYITQVALTGGRTINVTRVDGYISSVSDGTRTWNYNRDGDNQITDWEVVTI